MDRIGRSSKVHFVGVSFVHFSMLNHYGAKVARPTDKDIINQPCCSQVPYLLVVV